MTILLSARDLAKAYSTRQLFQGVDLHVARGQKIGLIGPNGAGKSTLLQILAGTEKPDDGEITLRSNTIVAYVAQAIDAPDEPMDQLLDSHLQHYCPSLDAGERSVRIATHLSRVGIQDHQQKAAELSGGWRKRFEIARQMVLEPDLLLLDEPTNHLDLEGILWLEAFLRRQVPTYVVVSHDRAFLQAVTTHMVEINPKLPQGVYSCAGDYSTFLEHRDQLLASQQQTQRALQGKVRREVEWLRRSPPARTSKSRSRINAAESLQKELQSVQTRNTDRKAAISFAGTGRETRKLVTATNLSKSLGGRTLFQNVDITLSPGVRLGLVGVNGTGKSTLLRILSGQLHSDTGTVKVAEGVKILHFDQHREQLPLDITLRNALSEDGETVYYQGRPIHVSGWAERFLFPKDRLDQQLGLFSGGERARLLIARLVLQPADLLLLDEPTNDLDIDTLEILEESLCEFPGAVVLITHDRLMLDEVSTTILGLGCDSGERHFADFAQWAAYRQKKESSPSKTKEESSSSKESKPKKALKFSYNEQRELAGMEDKIAAAEAEVERLESDSLQATGAAIQEIYQKMGKAQETVDQLYARWEELETKKNKNS